jgi:osmoprotectant transport system permease protein
MDAFFGYLIREPMLVLGLTGQHIVLTLAAVGIAIAIALPSGVLITRYRRLGFLVIGASNLGQTIPSLAVLGLLIPLLGIGFTPALAALVLRAVLPIVINTYVGITEIEASVVQAARGMGMRDRQVLTMVELPLALPVIMAGIRTATVMSISIATLAALIGAGGLGDLIFQGIAMVDGPVLMAGVIPTAALAILADTLLGRLELTLTPRGVRV